ncbi:MAG: patatin-like phospholipase family protein [Bacteroidales bacterium]|nr:patatin-like phospholipase family protein [Bacteroidales bacterium]
MQFTKAILLIFILLAGIFNINAQKVGLVLSGGGAKGMAHIGVIRALEENNIPIDYIAGTSIGAIIGALYACGYSPDEMEAMLEAEEFKNWYKGVIPEKHYYYYKKNDEHAEMFGLKFSIKDSSLVPVLPTNLVANQPMDIGILEIYSRYGGGANYNFDNLFVPYRCVATDIHGNRAVVFSKGDLSLAVRASMTFPFYFKPISIDGTLLFDGGIVNNFPYDVMQHDFAPDYIIGSLVTSETEVPGEDDILLQIENMIMNEQLSLTMPDSLGITIVNTFGKVGLLDFPRLKEFSKMGYDNTVKLIPDIKKNVSRRSQLRDVNERRQQFQAKQPEMIIDNIITEGLDKAEQKYVNNSLKQNKKLLSLEQFKDAYYRLVLDNQIESAHPRAVYNSETGFFDMHLKVKKSNRYELQLGGNISSGFSNMAFIGVNYKILGKAAWLIHGNLYFGRLYSAIHVSSRIDFPSDVPLSLKFSGTLNRWDYYKSNSKTFFDDLRPPYLIHHDYNFRAEMIMPVGRTTKFLAGFNTGMLSDNYFQVNNFLQSDTADITDMNFLRFFAAFESNNQNFKLYPNKGTYRNIGISYNYGDETNIPGSTSSASDTAEVSHAWLHFNAINDSYFSLGKRFTLGVFGELSVSNIHLLNNYTSSVIAAQGFYPTPHSRTLFLEDYRANMYLAAGLKTIYKFTDRIDIRLEGYMFVPYQKILKQDVGNQIFKAYYSEPLKYFYPMAAATLVYNTPLGPASVSIHYYEKDGSRLYYLFHIGYLIFNKKATEY